jgi:hypothetical protein
VNASTASVFLWTRRHEIPARGDRCRSDRRSGGHRRDHPLWAVPVQVGGGAGDDVYGRVLLYGVYESGPPQDNGPVADFAKAVGRRPNLVWYYSGWGEPFQTSFAQTVSGHGAVTIMQWDPTDASVAGIAAGDYNS